MYVIISFLISFNDIFNSHTCVSSKIINVVTLCKSTLRLSTIVTYRLINEIMEEISKIIVHNVTRK